MQNPVDFYGVALPTFPSLNLDPHLLDAPFDAQNLTVETHRLLQYIRLSVDTFKKEESAVDDLSRELLRTLGFETDDYVIRTRHLLHLRMCGNVVSAQTNVSIVQSRANGNILLIEENKTRDSTKNPEPQLIAEAIAAFQFNNVVRRDRGLQCLASMTFPCIIMVGNQPTFYLVPVTQALSDAVCRGEYPAANTTIYKHSVVDHPDDHLGMTIADFREEVIQHYGAFRTLARGHWAAFSI